MRFKSPIAFLLLCGSVARAVQGGRTNVCGESCFLINELLQRKQLPLHGDISSFHNGYAFCYKGVSPASWEGLTKLWTDILVTIDITPDDGLIITRGNSSKSALSAEETKTHLWNGSRILHLSPYGVSCVGLVPSGLSDGQNVAYKFNAKVVPMYRNLLLFIAGLVLMMAAPQLSRSVTLFYGAGVTLGIVASVLILLYVFSKFVPKKNLLGLGILAGGYTVFASFFYWFWTEALEVALQHWKYMVGYVIVAGLISFAVLYRMSPPTDVRSLNLIQWTLQLVGLTFLYLSSPISNVGVAFVVCSLLMYCVPIRYNPVLLPFRLLYWLLSNLLSPFIQCCSCLSFLNPRHWFKRTPKHRFLTQEEYEEQGRVETKKALEELRQFCRQPDSDEIWDKVSGLHDPKRFTSFLSGKDHVSAQEQVDHDWSGVVLDDSSDSDTLDYEESNTPNTSHRSTASSSSSRSLNASSDSPTFTHSPSYYSHSHPHPSHLTSTPSSTYHSTTPPRSSPHKAPRHRPPSRY